MLCDDGLGALFGLGLGAREPWGPVRCCGAGRLAFSEREGPLCCCAEFGRAAPACCPEPDARGAAGRWVEPLERPVPDREVPDDEGIWPEAGRVLRPPGRGVRELPPEERGAGGRLEDIGTSSQRMQLRPSAPRRNGVGLTNSPHSNAPTSYTVAAYQVIALNEPMGRYEPFEYTITKDQSVMIYRQGRLVVTVGGAQGRQLSAKLGTDDDLDQRLLQRITGNYKRGNERA